MMNLNRQSFIGSGSADVLASLIACITGLGGGGSHIAQQLAHAGVGNFILIDHDRIDASNLNRLVGATQRDVAKERYKVDIAAKRIRALNPKAKIKRVIQRCEDVGTILSESDIIFGCVDSFLTRRDLEAEARRYCIPYIDIGMDVHEGTDEFVIGGQVALSMPESLCLRCMGILSDDVLNNEAALYGAAGDHPQVVWTNGVLASTAVGVFMSLFLPWHRCVPPIQYLEYDGNLNEVRSSLRIPFFPKLCTHFDSLNSLGDPFFYA